MRLPDAFRVLTEFYDDRYALFRRNAELVRHQTAMLVNLQLPRNSRMAPERLWKFPWEVKERKSEMPPAPVFSENEINEMIKSFHNDGKF